MAGPILDNHIHLDEEHGRGLAAVEEFADAGGTHLMIVNKPTWNHGIDPASGDDFRPVFDRTIDIARRATDILAGRAWPVLGVHPALISRLTDGEASPTTAADIMQSGLDVAAEYTADGPAVALKSGRPHYDVTGDVWTASNTVIRRAFALGAETGVPVQLHTEATDDLRRVATWAESAGLPAEHVVKHYAGGRCAGVTPSVISRREELQQAVTHDAPFMMETDYLDDPDRPGAVLGPKTVPRRVEWLREAGFEEAVQTAHIETPRRVYGVDTTA